MDNKLITLITALTEKNLNNDTIWQKTSGNNEFKIQLNKATLTIDKWDDEDGDNYSLEIYNENGEKIQYLHSMESDESDQNNFETLMKLHNSVIKTYFKVEETIDNILNEITNNKVIGKN